MSYFHSIYLHSFVGCDGGGGSIGTFREGSRRPCKIFFLFLIFIVFVIVFFFCCCCFSGGGGGEGVVH